MTATREFGNITSQARLDRDDHVMHCIVIAAAATLVYLNSLSGVFLFDDDTAIVTNSAIQDFWSFGWFSLRGRPVSTLTLAINYAAGGLDPLGYHVANIAIHVINGLLLYGVISSAIEARGITVGSSTRSFAFVSALLWVVHPVCTQSVTYVVQRSESLAAMGILATLLCWSKASTIRKSDSSQLIDKGHRPAQAIANERAPQGITSATSWLAVAVLSSMLAYGSKESAAFLPLILLLFDRVFFSRSWRAVRQRAGWHVAVCLPVVIGAGVYAVAFFNGQHQDQTVGFSMSRITPWNYFASQPFVFLQYLKVSVLPIEQSLDYGWLPSEDRSIQVIGLLLWSGLLLAAAWLLFRKPAMGFVAWASLLILAPSSSLVPLQDIIFEHRIYLPLVSVCLLVAAILNATATIASSRFGFDRDRWLVAATTLVVFSLGFLTMSRNRDYFSKERMFAADVKRNPDNPRALANLAATRDFDDPDECISMYKSALELYQRRSFFYAGTEYKLTRTIADIYFLTARPREASPYYVEALSCANDALQEAEVHFSLAMIASTGGESKEADRHFAQATQKASTLPGLQEAYAVHQSQTGRKPAEIDWESIESRPK